MKKLYMEPTVMLLIVSDSDVLTLSGEGDTLNWDDVEAESFF